jgi:hypothetical protein
MTSWITRPKKDIVKNEAVICAIALQEERYIDEWINYHLKLGFYHIYIYDNSDNYVLKNRKSDYVTVIHYPGKTKQLEVYEMFVTNYKRKFKWAAFIDIDEFIVLKKHRRIMDFLYDYPDCDVLVLNWIMFGTSNELTYRDEPVTKRFQKCCSHVHPHFKSICQLHQITYFANPNVPSLQPQTIIMDTSRTVIDRYENINGPTDIACIHHYYTKSEQEFREKLERGQADIIQKRSLTELDDIHTKNNDVINQDAWNFLIL